MRLSTESDDARSAMLGYARQQGERWGCPGWGCTPPPELPDESAWPLRSIAERVAEVEGLASTPRTCPFAAIYAPSSPLVRRTSEALALLDDGASEETAFPGGVLAVDRAALLLMRRARTARQRADDVARDEDRRRDAARKAADGNR